MIPESLLYYEENRFSRNTREKAINSFKDVKEQDAVENATSLHKEDNPLPKFLDR